TDPAGAPPGCENLFVLILAPSQPADPARGIDWSAEGPRVAERLKAQLEAWGLTDLRRHIVTQRIVTPADYTADFGNLRGEAFGLAHNFTQIGWFRPHNRHARYANLYFVGQSTHPGCGLPMVLMSAEAVEARIRNEVPSW
ncbi:MAG TPA: phytoene desaturase, partial [Gemmatimonadales bacterium]|nr:phytoene desaturase [Gemmatimonadales bacterium]